MYLMYLPTIAKALLACSSLLFVRGLAKRKTYEPRFGKTSWVTFGTTILVILVNAVRPAPSLTDSMADLKASNATLIASESEFKAAELIFDQNYQAFIDSFGNVEKAHDLKEDLRVVGTLAGQTAVLGRQLMEHFQHLKKAGRHYGFAFRSADASYENAKSSLDYWATEENAFLEAAESLRGAATKESYQDLVDGYKALADALEMASGMRRTSVSHIEMSLEELEATMDYVESANRFLEAVEHQCLTLAEWRSPEVILSELKKYQTGITVVGQAIVTLKDHVAEESATKANAQTTTTNL